MYKESWTRWHALGISVLGRQTGHCLEARWPASLAYLVSSRSLRVSKTRWRAPEIPAGNPGPTSTCRHSHTSLYTSIPKCTFGLCVFHLFLWPFSEICLKPERVQRDSCSPPKPHPWWCGAFWYVKVRGPWLCLWSQHVHGQFCRPQNVSSGLHGEKLSAWPGLVVSADTTSMATVLTVCSTSLQ